MYKIDFINMTVKYNNNILTWLQDIFM